MRGLTAIPLAAALAVCVATSGCGASAPAGRPDAITSPGAPTTPVQVAVGPATHVSAAPVTRGSARRRWIALTFDADMTRPMLAAVGAGRVGAQIDRRLFAELRATRTPATIFLTGLWTLIYPDFARGLAADRLFELENHSFDHKAWTADCYGLPSVTTAATRRDEIVSAQRAIEHVTGKTPMYFRFPGGCATAADRQIVASMGLRTAGWDVISGDAFEHDPQVIVRKVLASVRPGSIIVAHCIGAPNTPATAQAMSVLIPRLKSEGYRFVTMERLLAS